MNASPSQKHRHLGDIRDSAIITNARAGQGVNSPAARDFYLRDRYPVTGTKI